jgi:hypothetical protein
MSKLTIRTGTEESFFSRGRQLAKLADQGETLPDERIISFEDPAEVIELIKNRGQTTFSAIKTTTH